MYAKSLYRFLDHVNVSHKSCSQHSSAAQTWVTPCQNGFWRICCNDVLMQGRSHRCILARKLSHVRLCCKQFSWCSHCLEKPSSLAKPNRFEITKPSHGPPESWIHGMPLVADLQVLPSPPGNKKQKWKHVDAAIKVIAAFWWQ